MSSHLLSSPQADLIMMHDLAKLSSYHTHHTDDDLKRVLLPPVENETYFVFTKELEPNMEVPCGFATWGFFTQAAIEGYLNKTRVLQPEDWDAGDRLWFIDIVAVNADVRTMVKALRKRIAEMYGEQTVMYFRRARGRVGWINVYDKHADKDVF